MEWVTALYWSLFCVLRIERLTGPVRSAATLDLWRVLNPATRRTGIADDILYSSGARSVRCRTRSTRSLRDASITIGICIGGE
jgi:hypothetical protein